MPRDNEVRDSQGGGVGNPPGETFDMNGDNITMGGGDVDTEGGDIDLGNASDNGTLYLNDGRTNYIDDNGTDIKFYHTSTNTVTLEAQNVRLVKSNLIIQGPGSNSASHLYGSTATDGGNMTSGATYTFSGALPANSLIHGISWYVLTEITGPTSIAVGVAGGDTDKWGTGITDFTVASRLYPGDYTDANPYAVGTSAGDVVITATGSNFTAGRIRLYVYYTTVL